jgi:RimJ/RimL family protein N-acetyltransferase
MAILWDERVGLRPFDEPLSAEEIARLYRWSRDEQLLRWSGGVPTDLSLAEFSERLRQDQRAVQEHRRVFFILTRERQLIGRIGIFAIDWTRGEGELGIVIGETSEWGKGYGRAAIRLLLHYAFGTLRLERMYLFTYPENTRAQRCFAACGFRSRGTAQRFSIERGEHIAIEMEITRRDFQSQRATHLFTAQQCSGVVSSGWGLSRF